MSGDWLALGAVGLLAVSSAVRRGSSAVDPAKRYADLKRLAAPSSGATPNERAIAQRLLASMTTPQQSGTATVRRRAVPWRTDPRDFTEIYYKDFRDLNFAKKAIYEHASKPRIRVSFHAFDGKHGRTSISAFGSRDDLGYGGMVLEAWTEPYFKQPGPSGLVVEAVVATTEDAPGEVRLVRVRGTDVVDQEIVIEHNSFNANPFNDRGFVQQLQQILRGWT